MVNPLDDLDVITEEIIENLNSVSYEDIEKFIADRAALLLLISDFFAEHPVTEEDKQKIGAILNKDVLIQTRIIELKNEASDWLTQRNSAKSRRNAYENHYSPDSILLDHKK